MSECLECKKNFAGLQKRAVATFCSSACRKTFNNRRMLRGAVLYDIAMTNGDVNQIAEKVTEWGGPDIKVATINVSATTSPPEPEPQDGRLVERVADFMADGEWRTLDQIRARVGGTEAGVSARLRDLRKPKFGSRIVERRRHEGRQEYRLQPD